MINYFEHDVNAARNPLIAQMNMDFKGFAAYGIYWRLIEEMANTPDGRLPNNNNLLGYMIGHVSADVINHIVNDYGLFQFSEDRKYIYVDFIQNTINKYNSKKEKAKQSAEARWSSKNEKCERNANAMQTHKNKKCECNANKIREDKIREDNINNISIKNDGGECVQPLLLPSPSEAKKEVKSSKQEQLEADFSFFWTIYPKKQGKKEALKAYIKARKKASRDELLEALREVKQKDWRNRELQYVPHASTWLNQERWTDEVQEQKKIDPLDDLDLENNPFEVKQ